MFVEYSLWWLPVIVIVALAVACWQYGYFFDKNKSYSYSKIQRRVLFAIRTLTLFLILFLLLSPVKRIKHKQIEKPTIVFAQDVSYSLDKTDKSYFKDLEKLCKTLKNKYNIVQLAFGNKTRPSSFDNKEMVCNDYATDFSNLYQYISENYNEQSLASIVLASDGISTQGHSLLNNEEYFSCPTYTIALGDTNQRKDIQISNIRYNKICYLDNEFPLEISIQANKCKGEKAALSMTYNNKTIVVKNFTITEEDFFLTVPYKELAKKVGINRLSFSVSRFKDESNKINNNKDIFIEVLDTKKKILVLGASPHPDISAIKNIAEENKNYECQIFTFTDITKANLNENYDIAVLHNLPNSPNSINIIKQLQKTHTPLLFIVGQQTNITYFNSLQRDIKINLISRNPIQSIAIYNNDFSSFNLNKASSDILAKLPPLLTPSAKYVTSPNLSVLAYQRIGSVSTTYPLIAFSSDNGYILGENIWRWRLHNYLINNSHNEINELLSKSLQIISNKEDKKHLRLETKEIYHAMEDVIVQAQLYNDNYELVNTPDVEFTITQNVSFDNQTQKKQTYTFGKTSNAYQTNLSKLPSGEYSIVAKTHFNNKTLTDKASFIVNQINVEYNDLVAKHNDLFTLAKKTGGKMIYPQELQKLKDYLNNNQEIKPIIYENTENKRFIALWWYWLLIVVGLSSEWFLRKYWGKI